MTSNRLVTLVSDAEMARSEWAGFGIATATMQAKRVGTPSDGFSRMAIQLPSGAWWWATGAVRESGDCIVWDDGSEIAP